MTDLLGIRRWAFLVAGLVWLVLALTAPPLQAACPPTKKALLWEVSRGDRAPGYLFGTYHLSAGDDRFERPMALARVALASAKTAAFELDLAEPGLNETIGQAIVATDGPSLDQLLGAELFAQALPLLEARGIPRSIAPLIKPWAVGTILLSTPKAQEGQPMDQVLQDWARDANIAIIGLERPEEQLGLFDNIPLHLQVSFAKGTLQEPDKIAAFKQRITRAYLDGDLESLLKMSLDGSTAAERALNDRFMEQFIFARNHRMADRLHAKYARGNLFVAVGALHLPGSQGLLSLLRRLGYDVSPVGWYSEVSGG